MSPTSNFRVLALDPGFDRLGVALVERQNGKDTLLYSTCLGSNEKDFTLRLLDLGNQIEKVIVEWSPQSFALEKLFFTNNRKTASQVSEARGMILYLAGKHGCPVVEFNPLEIKLTVAGYGRAEKAQVQSMVEKLLNLPPKKRLDDEYDAIAVGLTALAKGV